MKKIATLLFLCIALTVHAGTSITTTNVSGHWTMAGSPYEVYNDITVLGSSSLVIDPGVTVVFHGPYRLEVQGILYAVGSATSQINFTVADTVGFSTDTTTAAGGWHGIQYETYGGTPGTDTSMLQYCNITYTKFGIGDDAASPQLSTLYSDRKLSALNCNIHDNYTVPNVGVDLMYFSTSANAELGNCSIYNNRSGRANTILTWGTLNVHDSKLYQNLSTEQSVIDVLEANFTFTNNDLYSNTLTGIASAQGVLTIVGNATIKGNKIHDNIISKCAAIWTGGGLIDVIDNLICNNQHTSGLCGIIDGGGALNLCWNSSFTHAGTFYNVRNNIIANNYSPFQAGALKVYCAGANITNNTIINNSSAAHAAIYIFDNDTSNYVVKNNVFYGNEQGTLSSVASSAIDAIIYYGNIEYEHNWQESPSAGELNLTCVGCTTSGDTSKNLVGTNPGLVAPTTGCSVLTSALTSDFSLLSSSPCINKGDTAGVITEPTDYAGKPRITGGIIDIGAFEYTPTILNTLSAQTPQNIMSVYPNPTRDMLYVSVPEAKGVMILMDLSGKQLMEKTVTETITSFDVSSIAHGIYFIAWENGNVQKMVTKIVVE